MLTRIDKVAHIDCPALGVLAALAAESAQEFGVALAGGAVRDTVHNVPVADHDIIIYDFDPDWYQHGLLDDILVVMHKAGYKLQQLDDDGEYADARVAAVAQFAHAVYPDVDILFHPNDTTVQSVLLKHDFNINNYVAVVDDIVDHPERQAVYFVGESVQGVMIRQPYQETIDRARVEKMIAKAEQIGWGVSASIRALVAEPEPQAQSFPWS